MPRAFKGTYTFCTEDKCLNPFHLVNLGLCQKSTLEILCWDFVCVFIPITLTKEVPTRAVISPFFIGNLEL